MRKVLLDAPTVRAAAASVLHGTFTVFGQPASPASLTTDPNPYTMGMQFSVSQPGTLGAIWFYSAPSAAALPGTIALFTVAGGTIVHQETPTWSGAAGSGWVRAPFASPPALTAGVSYKGCVLQPGTVNWYASVANYWATGPGGLGLTSGPITAPNNAGGDGGQDTFNTATTLSYPATSFNSTNYWVDVEVTV